MPGLTPLTESPSLDKLAYDQIKEAILTFQFLPNQALIEGELASQLGISKTPVRDALMRLEKEGLVVRLAYKGTYVSDINNQDMMEIYQIRIVLEGLAIRLAAEALVEEDFDALQKLIERHEVALKRHEVRLVSEINSEFHNIKIVETQLEASRLTRVYQVTSVIKPGKNAELSQLFQKYSLQIRNQSQGKHGNALVIMVKATGRAEDHEALADALMADVEVKDFEYT